MHCILALLKTILSTQIVILFGSSSRVIKRWRTLYHSGWIMLNRELGNVGGIKATLVICYV